MSANLSGNICDDPSSSIFWRNDKLQDEMTYVNLRKPHAVLRLANVVSPLHSTVDICEAALLQYPSQFAVSCSASQCVAVCCGVLQCVAVYNIHLKILTVSSVAIVRYNRYGAHCQNLEIDIVGSQLDSDRTIQYIHIYCKSARYLFFLMSPTPRRKWYLTTGRRFH